MSSFELAFIWGAAKMIRMGLTIAWFLATISIASAGVRGELVGKHLSCWPYDFYFSPHGKLYTLVEGTLVDNVDYQGGRVRDGVSVLSLRIIAASGSRQNFEFRRVGRGFKVAMPVAGGGMSVEDCDVSSGFNDFLQAVISGAVSTVCGNGPKSSCERRLQKKCREALTKGGDLARCAQ
jgi:hypothetical protein